VEIYHNLDSLPGKVGGKEKVKKVLQKTIKELGGQIK